MSNILFKLNREMQTQCNKKRPTFFLQMHSINILGFNKVSLDYGRDLRLCQEYILNKISRSDCMSLSSPRKRFNYNHSISHLFNCNYSNLLFIIMSCL